MAEFPFLPLATDAYLSDTRHLTTVEHGAYLLLLITAWRRADCRLPNDDTFLAKSAGLNRRAWGDIRDTIMAFWHIDDDGFWTQKRLVQERIRVAARVKQRTDAANAKWRKNKGNGDAGASGSHAVRIGSAYAPITRTRTREEESSIPPSDIEANRIERVSVRRGVQGGGDLAPQAPVQPAPTRTGSPAPTTTARKRAVPPQWQPAEQTIDWLGDRFPALDWGFELPRFRDHHASKGSRFADIDAAFRNWCTNAATDFGRRPTAATGEPHRPVRPTLGEDEWDAVVAAYFGHLGQHRAGQWSSGYGPKPGEPGCFAPARFVERYRRPPMKSEPEESCSP